MDWELLLKPTAGTTAETGGFVVGTRKGVQKSEGAGRFHRMVLSSKMRNESRGSSRIVTTAELTLVVFLSSITRILTVALRGDDDKRCISSLILLTRRKGYGV